MWQHFARDVLRRIFQEKCRGQEADQNSDANFARACAVETHVKISQEPLLHKYVQQKNTTPKVSTLIKPWPLFLP